MVAEALLPAENVPNPNKPLSRLREVASRRRAETQEQRKMRAKQEEDLIAAQEALHRRVDGSLVTGAVQAKAKDRFIFLARSLSPDAETDSLRMIANEIGRNECAAGASGGTMEEPTHEDKDESAFRLQVEDQKSDRRSDFLSILYRNAGEPGDDYNAFCKERMCRALLRGYRSFQSFAALLAEYTTEPVPSVQTVNDALKCMDGDCDDLTYMETLERWLPEIIPVAVALLTTYADAVRAERAANGSEPVLTRSIDSSLPVPKRGTPIEDITCRVCNTYAVVPNVNAVAKAFRKDNRVAIAILTDRGVYQSHGGKRKKSEY